MTEPVQPRTPPRFVPTLTAVIAPGPVADEVDTASVEERVLQRLMTRIDGELETRLGDAVAAAVEAQLDVMVPLLRRDMQAALRALVSEAVARELAENPRSPGV
ncbi:hypothetical protein NF681_11195 [Comamonadaceae bacterium OTU4NAUVB1]|jgi:DNA-binding transcriptional regulator YbjK|nr:hypothetical protein NF681_11195 [Comamonadaceae bacterium OTU4NAUVB1]HSU22273.1 hypothetical protein [Variovorax sp.]